MEKKVQPPKNLPIKTPTDPYSDHPLVLGISPTSRGFAFMLMEAPDEPLDWGIVNVRVNKNPVCIKKIKELIAHYAPQVIVIENPDDRSSRRCSRIKRLLTKIQKLGHSKHVYVATYSRETISDLFTRFGASTKHEIATALVEWLPALSTILPEKRKIWESEQYQMAVFDATAFVIAFYFSAEDEKSR